MSNLWLPLGSKKPRSHGDLPMGDCQNDGIIDSGEVGGPGRPTTSGSTGSREGIAQTEAKHLLNL
jgi:hypothetical protein